MFEPATFSAPWHGIGRAVALALLTPLPAASTLAATESTTQQLIVKFKSEGTARRALSAQDRVAALAGDAATTLSYLRPMALEAHVVTLDHAVPLSEARAVADRLAANADVEYAQPDRRLKASLVPSDEFIFQQTYLGSGAAGISAFAAWEITTGSPNVVVAVVDTGFRPHAGIAGRFVQGYDFISDPAMANDGDDRDSDASDPGDWVSQADKDGPLSSSTDCPIANSSWHGTAVSGVIGANGNDHAWTAGIDWSAKILPVRVLGKCGGSLSDIIDGVAWAAGLIVPGAPVNATPAQVINMSLGDSSTTSCSAIEQSVFNAALANGVTRAIVVAAGNGSDDIANHAPANCSGVISVGATTSTGNRAAYSNFGPTLIISAPGGQYPQFDGIYALTDSGKTVPVGDAIAIYNGTSLSAPMVSGVVSLMLGVAPNLTADQVRSILTSSAKPFPPESTCSTSLCGAGIVNAQAAVQAAQATAGGVNYTDLWWFGEAFNGTGVSIIEHHDVLFATWYVYDANGKGSWFVMPGGGWDANHKIFSGAMYSTLGTPFNNYAPPATLLQAGTLSLQFSDSRGCDDAAAVRPGRYAHALRLQRFVVGRNDAGRMGPDAQPTLRHACRNLVHLRARRKIRLLLHPRWNLGRRRDPEGDHLCDDGYSVRNAVQRFTVRHRRGRQRDLLILRREPRNVYLHHRRHRDPEQAGDASGLLMNGRMRLAC
jgi:serine protease